MAFSPVQLTSLGGLHAAVLNQLGQSIVRGDIAPGAVLPNADDLSLQFGVSRTVIREVVKVLAAKGMVESRPKTGTRVRARHDWNFLDSDILNWRFSAGIKSEEAKSIFELRRAIEPMAARLAAERATPADIATLERHLALMEHYADDSIRFAEPDLAFHQAILRMTGNELFSSLASVIETALVVSFHLTDDNPQGQRASLVLHRHLLEAIAIGDADRASAAVLVLLDEAEEDVRRSLGARRSQRASG
ncbi:FadR/GntR family transcriptional regulator [Devosia sp.]|uniref:FadR/GntR family transcriptional regulator n=1 Tax=Devosia sp. TaxID=1871048 RepID=UPI0025BA7BA7|nr:FadR/GntR family transcriptional regulator [Devosia sp.]